MAYYIPLHSHGTKIKKKKKKELNDIAKTIWLSVIKHFKGSINLLAQRYLKL